MGMQLSCWWLRCRACICRWQVAMDRNPQPTRAICNLKFKSVKTTANCIENSAKNYFGGLSSETTQVDLPQNGANSHDLPGSTVAQRVLAKHIPGKSAMRERIFV